MPAPAADPLTATRSELALLCATLGGASSTRIEKFVLSFFDTQLLSAVATRPAVPRVMLPPSLLNNNSSANSSSKPNDAGVQQPLETKCKADTEEACQALVGCKWCMTIDLEWCQPAAKVKCKE